MYRHWNKNTSMPLIFIYKDTVLQTQKETYYVSDWEKQHLWLAFKMKNHMKMIMPSAQKLWMVLVGVEVWGREKVLWSPSAIVKQFSQY